jgi:hypothetical protein
MIDDRMISFETDSLGYAVLGDTTLQRFPGNGRIETIPLSEVRTLYTKGPDQTRTVIGMAMGVGLLVLIAGSITHGLRSGSW